MGLLLSVFVPLLAPIVSALLRPLLPLLLPLHERLSARPRVTAQFVAEHVSQEGAQLFPLPAESPLRTIYRYIAHALRNTVSYHLTPRAERETDAQSLQELRDAPLNREFDALCAAVRATKHAFAARDVIVAAAPMRELLRNADCAFSALSSLSSASSPSLSYLPAASSLSSAAAEGKQAVYDAQMSIARFVVGQGLALNVKLSHAQLALSLTEREREIRAHLRRTLSLVPPLSQPVTLFHGFEPHVRYSFFYERERVADGVSRGEGARFLQQPGFLVKTPCAALALRNARKRESLRPEVLVVRYPAGSAQLHFNVRFKDSEFELFAADHERLRVLCERRVWQGLVCATYYICEPA